MQHSARQQEPKSSEMGRTTFASSSSGNAESLLPEEQGRVLHVLDEFYIVNTGCNICPRLLEIPVTVSAAINNRSCAVSFLGPSSVLLPHNCDAYELSVSMRVRRVRRRALHANDSRDRAWCPGNARHHRRRSRSLPSSRPAAAKHASSRTPKFFQPFVT